MSEKPLPTNLLEAVRYFSDLDVAVAFVAKMRWPHGPVCPRCACIEHSYLTTRRVWKCKACKKQYSVKAGTIFEDSPLGLDERVFTFNMRDLDDYGRFSTVLAAISGRRLTWAQLTGR